MTDNLVASRKQYY